MSVLLFAAAHDYVEVVQALLKCLNTNTNYQNEVFKRVSIQRYYDRAYQAYFIYFLKQEGLSSLMFASRDGYTETVRILLSSMTINVHLRTHKVNHIVLQRTIVVMNKLTCHF